MVAEQSVQEDWTQRKPLALIKSAKMRQLVDCSRSQEYVRIKSDPDWPRPLVRNGVRYYVLREAEEYIAKLIARRDANGAPAEVPPAPPAEPRPGHCRDCGVFLPRTGARGRPPIRCAACRGIAEPAL